MAPAGPDLPDHQHARAEDPAYGLALARQGQYLGGDGGEDGELFLCMSGERKLSCRLGIAVVG